MKLLTSAATILALAVTPVAGWAGNGNGKGKGNGNKVKVERVTPGGTTRSGQRAIHCPPGLARKAVPCLPPGQIKSRYAVGDVITRDYLPIDHPGRYGLPRDGYYLRAGDYVYRVSRETHKVLNLIGAVADILN
ncbi:hypothetical protein [Pukyongiella litopenaei]|uniref:Nickel/cobalt transporter regulator n=1 Tax=Pukyongiella litopenaei TaxID=2605946 RepID=A0A2S0MT69_9RHOB|nr:hypothetical protein [Pukyongiella litopenaei]AVO39080.1 hypothetical protein C6Y53_16080 [Pukyongiella litopenaei]